MGIGEVCWEVGKCGGCGEALTNNLELQQLTAEQERRRYCNADQDIFRNKIM